MGSVVYGNFISIADELKIQKIREAKLRKRSGKSNEKKVVAMET